jgi:phosphopantothenoylcysteine synthetase/decarboxylase
VPVLYLVACGAPPAADLVEVVPRFQVAGWRVAAIATPMAARFIDVMRLADITGLPVRSEYKEPNAPDVHPPADAVAVAPASFNTINKWAAGISDTLALGILNELLASGLPIAVGVWAKPALRAHPAYAASERVLAGAGVTFLPGGSGADGFPWQDLVAWVKARL